MEQRYREMWNMAIHDKLSCEIKIRRGMTKKIILNTFGICSQYLWCRKGKCVHQEKSQWNTGEKWEYLKYKKEEQGTSPEWGKGGWVAHCDEEELVKS